MPYVCGQPMLQPFSSRAILFIEPIGPEVKIVVLLRLQIDKMARNHPTRQWTNRATRTNRTGPNRLRIVSGHLGETVRPAKLWIDLG